MKTYGGVEVQLHHSWAQHLIDVSGQLHGLAAASPGRSHWYSLYKRLGGPQSHALEKMITLETGIKTVFQAQVKPSFSLNICKIIWTFPLSSLWLTTSKAQSAFDWTVLYWKIKLLLCKIYCNAYWHLQTCVTFYAQEQQCLEHLTHCLLLLMSAQSINCGFMWMLHGAEEFSSHGHIVTSLLDLTGDKNTTQHYNKTEGKLGFMLYLTCLNNNTFKNHIATL
jgi:hypothetical protein